MPQGCATCLQMVVQWFKTQYSKKLTVWIPTLSQAVTWIPVFVFLMLKPVWFNLQLGHFPIYCISGSGPGAHYQNRLWQTEEWRLPESWSAGSQPLQPPLSCFNHIPGTPQILAVWARSNELLSVRKEDKQRKALREHTGYSDVFPCLVLLFQTTLLHFWEKTSHTMAAIHESFKGCQHYEFSTIKVRKHLKPESCLSRFESWEKAGNKSVVPADITRPPGQAGKEEGEKEK